MKATKIYLIPLLAIGFLLCLYVESYAQLPDYRPRCSYPIYTYPRGRSQPPRIHYLIVPSPNFPPPYELFNRDQSFLPRQFPPNRGPLCPGGRLVIPRQ